MFMRLVYRPGGMQTLAMDVGTTGNALLVASNTDLRVLELGAS